MTDPWDLAHETFDRLKEAYEKAVKGKGGVEIRTRVGELVEELEKELKEGEKGGEVIDVGWCYLWHRYAIRKN